MSSRAISDGRLSNALPLLTKDCLGPFPRRRTILFPEGTNAVSDAYGIAFRGLSSGWAVIRGKMTVFSPRLLAQLDAPASSSSYREGDKLPSARSPNV